MFKLIPGNKTLVVSLSQEFRRYNGEVVNFPSNNGLITIELYGKMENVCPKWVSLIAHFEIYTPDQDFKSLLNVIFVNTNITFLRPVSGKIPLFKKPVTITHNKKIFRVIPSFSRYAVSNDGEVIEVSSKETTKVSLERKKHGVVVSNYPSTYIYDPEILSYKYVLIHRLVALAWVKNTQDNFVFRPIVNHIDGNKRNYHFKNLEWCSFKENNNHAADTGLTKEHVKCKIRDFGTGIVYKFRSLSEAEQLMGVNPGTLRTNKLNVRKSKLYCNKYELKLDSDNTPWFYENRVERVKSGRYIIEVTDTNGKTEYYHDTRDLKEKFQLWNCPNIKTMLDKARAENLGCTFTVHDNYNSRPIQAFNTETSEILETKTIIAMSEKINVPEYTIRYCLNGDERWVKGIYAFRYKSNSEWNKDFIDKNEGKGNKIKATNTLTKEVLEFESIRQTARHFGVKDRYWLRQCILQGKDFNGWKLDLRDVVNGYK